MRRVYAICVALLVPLVRRGAKGSFSEARATLVAAHAVNLSLVEISLLAAEVALRLRGPLVLHTLG